MKKPWYQEGLRFLCTGCGKCCTGSPGYVFVSEEEIETMALSLNLPLDEFVKRFIRKVGNRLSLKENEPDYDCVFLKNKTECSIYKARPKQCQTFPFWKQCVESKKEWIEEGRRCEGINHPDAPLIPLCEIKQRLKEED